MGNRRGIQLSSQFLEGATEQANILPIGGCYYTWMNKAGTKLSKIDYFLIPDDILEAIPDIHITALDRLLSNDRTLLLHEKLRSIKGSIKQWHNNIKINDRNKRLEALNDLKVIDKKIDDGSAKENDRENLIKLLQDIDNLDNLEARDLIQKAHIKWDIEDFHPISLIGIHYKIIAKIIANRLSKVIDRIVSKEQSTFIAGQQILDRPLILNEVIDWFKKIKKKMLIFKVDFEKAFYSVSWKNLDFVLLSLGFSSKWRSWIRACLHSSRASILINGSPTSEFSIKHGLRQGDPLSPFLFIFVMEGLHCAMSNVVSTGLIHGIKIGSSDITLSYLFYADDVIITIDWNSRDLDNIIRALHTNRLCIRNLPFHLSWSSNRGGSQDSRKLSWIKWSNVLSSFDKEGLNIGSLKAFNLALLQKWHWRLFSSPNSLWIKVIKSFHGYECGFDTEGCKFNDIWIGDSPLYTRYNRLFRLDPDKDCLIIDRISNGQWKWNWSREDIGVKNKAYLRELLLEISLVDIIMEEDSCVWDMAIDGIFSVGDNRRLIDAKILPTLVPLTSWDKTLPRKVNIFIWRLALDRLPHRLNLSARGMDIASIACPSYNDNVESSSHIFFDCDFAKEIWRLISSWCDFPLPTFTSYGHWMSWFTSWQAPKQNSHCLYIIVVASFWWIWRFRNSVIFCPQPLRKSDMFDNIRSSSFSWLSYRGRMSCSRVDWIKASLLIAR
ncbi:RNA-directed DNA polymerase, eukaryota, reverse transcriptase zinc-binding domain protein [Tanacetum coccineum]